MLPNWHKPDWLYELLPYVYLGSGVLTITTLQNVIGLLSGLLLSTTGAAIWVMRRRYRSSSVESQVFMSRREEPFNSGDNLVQLKWRTSFECGNELIDSQHRNLVILANTLINAVVAKLSNENIQLILYELLEGIAMHFAAEEKLLAEHHRPLSESHLESHRSILARIKKLSEAFRCGQLPVRELMGFVVYDVVAQHIIQEKFAFSTDQDFD